MLIVVGGQEAYRNSLDYRQYLLPEDSNAQHHTYHQEKCKAYYGIRAGVAAAPALAATATGEMTVSSSVTASCVISAAPLGFAPYNTVTTDDVDTTAVPRFTCTSGTAEIQITLGQGHQPGRGNLLGCGTAASDVGWRHGSASLLPLPGCCGGTVRGNTTATAPAAIVGTGAAQTATVFGRIPSLQTTVPEGTYTDTVGGEPYVLPSSLAPTITYELDEATLILRLTVSPDLLPPTVLNLRTDRPPGLIYMQNPSAFVNYSLNWSDFERFDAFSEAGISLGGNLLAGSFTRTGDGEFIRGYTSLTLDQRDSLRRWVIGDRFIGTCLLGGGAFLGGISVSRDFSLDPYLFRYPSLGFAGALLTPSTVDVYVNGILLRREQLPPGPFELRNLPVVSGSGFTQVVIRDAFGREQAITQPYYFSTGLLAPGLSEYGYNLGFEWLQSGMGSWDYGSLVFLGRHRLGLN